MIIAIVNDNDYDAQCCVDDTRSAFPDAEILSFDSLYTAHECSIDIDMLIIDISAVAPISLGMAMAHYGPICTFLERRPGVSVVITSAVTKEFAENVREDVLARVPAADVYVVEWPWHDKLLNFLKTFA